MRLLICGGREYDDWKTFCDEVDKLLRVNHIDCIIHGNAKGADFMARLYARYHGYPEERYDPDWLQGPRGGIIRNEKMLAEGKPDLVLAFPGSKGTNHMIQIARKAGVPVIVVTA